MSDLLSRVWINLLFVAFGVAFWVSVSDLPGDAANYPRTVIVVLVAFVLYGFVADVAAWKRDIPVPVEDDEAQGAERDAGPLGLVKLWWKSVVTLALTAVFVWAIPRAGFYESAAVYLLVLFFLLGIRRPLILLPLTAGLTVASYLLFDVLFNVLVPTGPLLG